MMGVVKLVSKQALRDIFREFEEKITQLGDNLTLEGEIMLSFSQENLKTSLNDKKSSLHTLYLDFRQNARYILGSGQVLEIIESSGIKVPERQEIARINFYPSIDESQCSPLELTGMPDYGKIIYARRDEVDNALNETMRQIKNYESNTINIRKVCPQAKSDRNGPVIVSVANIGDYFNKFPHFGADLPRHYLSGHWDDSTFTIVPAHAIIWVDDSVQH